MEPAIDCSGKVYFPNEANNQIRAVGRDLIGLRFGRVVFAARSLARPRTEDARCSGQQRSASSPYLAARLTRDRNPEESCSFLHSFQFAISRQSGNEE